MAPTSVPRSGASKPTASELRAPKIRRERISRPKVSVPRRWAALGPARRAIRLILLGSSSGRSPASKARPATSVIHAAASQKIGPRPRRRRGVALTPSARSLASSAAMSNPWIERDVEQVDDDVDEDEGDRDKQNGALQHDEVPCIDRVDDEPSDARQREYRLDHDCATDKAPDVETDHRDEGKRRRLQCMDEKDAPRLEAFGPCHGDIVLLERGDHVAAQHAHERRPFEEGEGGAG